MIGIDISTAELDLFQDIAYFKYAANNQFLERTKLLLEKLMTANNHEVFFSKSFYQNSLAEYWFNVHYNLTKYKGMGAWFHYNAGIIGLTRPLSLSTKAKFILKGLLKK